MLVLSRDTGESIIIGGVVRVTINKIDGNKVQLGIDAPKEIVVDRAEVAVKRELLDGSFEAILAAMGQGIPLHEIENQLDLQENIE